MELRDLLTDPVAIRVVKSAATGKFPYSSRYFDRQFTKVNPLALEMLLDVEETVVPLMTKKFLATNMPKNYFDPGMTDIFIRLIRRVNRSSRPYRTTELENIRDSMMKIESSNWGRMHLFPEEIEEGKAEIADFIDNLNTLIDQSLQSRKRGRADDMYAELERAIKRRRTSVRPTDDCINTESLVEFLDWDEVDEPVFSYIDPSSGKNTVF